MWMLNTRPDLGYVVKDLARALQAPTVENEMNLKRVLRYFISTRDYVLHLEVDPTKEENFLSVEVD
eukprot:12496320-Heterocapsa_arctica.AAC.1